MSESSWPASLAALARFYVGSATVEETLTRVSELAVEAVPPAEFVGLTMAIEGSQRTAVFTDPESPDIDQAQYDSGEGPCVDAFRLAQTFIIDSTATDTRWPAFCRTANDHGILATLSMPMLVEHRALGAMNFYARTEKAFGDLAIERAEPFAAQAAIVLGNSHAYWDSRALSERLSEAIDHRAVIEQAKGILMATQHCEADGAFELLVAASQRENVKVRDLAQRIVDRASQPQG